MVTGTKVGKTVGCSIWLLKQAWDNPLTKWWWVAPIYKQTKIGFDNMCSMLPQGLYTKKITDMSIHLPNGSTIECRSGDNPDNLFGEAVNGIVLDEASRLKEEAFNAIRTTLTATRGKAKVISNPKGRNWFYRYYCMGQDISNKNYRSYSLSTYDSPYVDKDVIEDAKRTLPESVFRELYMGEFLEDSAGVFRNVQQCIDDTCWSEPVPMQSYVIGVDLARYQDFTVICVMNQNNGSVAAWDRFNQIDWGLQKLRIVSMVKRYNNARLLLDSTGVGDPILEDIKRLGINAAGYKFTNESKQSLIESLIAAIEQRKIRFPNIPQLISELGAFEYKLTRACNITYAAPEGLHDDCVIALALAVRQLTNHQSFEFMSTGVSTVSSRI